MLQVSETAVETLMIASQKNHNFKLAENYFCSKKP